MKMNEEVKRLWCGALESGEFDQGSDTLRYGDRFCCLGVLCELYRRHTGQGAWDGHHFVTGSQRNRHTLPPEVVSWAGLRDENPDLGGLCAAEWNDDRKKSLREIARLIREYL